jgi:hypothetical protein
LQNVEQVVVLLRGKLSGQSENAYIGVQRLVTQVFFHVKPDDIDRVNEYSSCETINCTMELHSIRSMGVMDVNKLMKKSFSCFCCFSVGGNFPKCENLPWTKGWEVEMLIPSNIRFIGEVMLDAFDQDDWDQFGVNGDHFASCLTLGDNFVVNVK